MSPDTPGMGTENDRGDGTAGAEDELVFAAQDLGRERGEDDGGEDEEDLGFALAPRPVSASAPLPLPRPTPQPAPPVLDGFVIREPAGVAPTAPVDALVVGAPALPVSEPEPSVPIAPQPHFRVGPSPASTAGSEPPWLVRDPSPQRTPAASRRGWTTRQSELVDRSLHATLLRLREEAVHVSWKAAWMAVTAEERRRER